MWRLIIVVVVIILGVGGIRSAHAQNDDWAYWQWAMDVIFAINEDDTISMIIDTTFATRTLDNVNMMWLIPVPNMPTIEILPSNFVGEIKYITRPQFILPHHPCDNIHSDDISVHPAYLHPVHIEEYAILAYNEIEEAIQQWRDEGYVLPSSLDATIAGYIQQEMFFVAIPLDFSRVTIDPIQITYRADTPILPLLLADSPYQPPIRVWILGDTPYIPENITHHQLDYTTFTTYSEIYGDIYIWENFYAFNQLTSGYYEPRIQALADQHHGVFITEMALPTRELSSTDDALVDDWLDQFAYITRFRGQLTHISPENDIIFVPAPDFPDTPPLVDLNEYVDPLHFWGCSTRATMQPTTYLSSMYTSMYIGYTRVYYPQGWVLSELIGQVDLPVYVFSPEPVTLETIHAYFDEQSTPPMFLYLPPITSYRVERDYFQYGYDWQDYLAVVLGLRENEFGHYSTFNKEMGWYHQEWVRYSLDFYAPQKDTFVLLTTDDDIQTNRKIYEQLGVALYDYAYYVSRYLRHTLILTMNGMGEGVTMVGFPQGWIEHTMINDEIIITPQNRDEPSVKIIPLVNLRLVDRWNQQEIAPILARYYGVLRDDFYRMLDFLPHLREDERDCKFDLYRIGGLEFEKDGRSGFITLSEHHLIVASAPHDLFPYYRHILKMMTDSVRGDNVCG